MTLPDDYVWIPVFAGIFAFIMAFGIGANDVANAFATSVGAKTLTLKQAVMIASVTEFLGAVTMGAHVASTVKDDIIDIDLFESEPEALMFIMMCALLGAGSWLLIASYFGWPVSTTHSIIGAVAGGGLAAKGADGIGWETIIKIVISWLVTPAMSGVLALIFFLLARYLVLRYENSRTRAFYAFPFLALAVFTINTFFIMYKGSPQLELDETPLDVALGVAFGIGGGAGIIAFLLAYFYLNPRIEKEVAEELAQSKMAAAADGNSVQLTPITPTQGPYEVPQTPVSVGSDAKSDTKLAELPGKKWYEKGVSQDVHECAVNEQSVRDIHQNTEEYDPYTERMFSYMQVLTAIFDSFAHGANDVANSIGPFAAVIQIYQDGEISSKSEVPVWILVIGGAGIVIGLALYGYNVIESIGVKLTKITPSRGFSIELSTAIVVIISSRYELPVSTTHCQVGATMGAGLADGHKSINWILFLKVIASWVFTLVFAGFVTATFVSFGYYSPSAY